MNAFVVFALVACASAAPSGPVGHVSVTDAGYGPSHLVRAPAHDSASIEHHRLGGNFAYSTAEAHAFARITPKLNTITYPNAETTVVHQPSSVTHVQPAPIVNTHHAAQPIIKHQPVLAQQPVIGPVAARTEVHRPVVRTQHLVHEPAVVANVATTHHVRTAPAVAHVAAAPAYAIGHAGYAAGPAYAHAAGPANAHAAPLAHGYALPAAHAVVAAPHH